MLYFDIDADDLKAVADELGASQQQIQKAFNRALNRTAGTLRKMSSKGLQGELQLRNAKAIRKRLKTIKLKRGKGMDEVRLWFGSNDLAISAFKGSPKKTRTGASFRGHDFPGAFVAKGRSGKRTILKRVGSERLPVTEQTLPVKDQMDVFVEDEIFAAVPEIFFKHFRADLRARTIYGVG